MTDLKEPRSVTFTIPGRIGGKGRARAFVRGGKIGMFTPQKTTSQEAIVRQFAALAMAGTFAHHSLLLKGALRLSVTLNRPFPKSWSMKKREHAFWITGKPDCDNTLKLIADAMNGIVYQDDSQIAQLIMSRMWGLPECVGVTVMELEG